MKLEVNLVYICSLDLFPVPSPDFETRQCPQQQPNDYKLALLGHAMLYLHNRMISLDTTVKIYLFCLLFFQINGQECV